MNLTITISGLHGTGKTSYAKILSKTFTLRHLSAGQLFRQIAKEKNVSVIELGQVAISNYDIDHLIDERTRKEARKGNVIIDGLLAGWIARNFAEIKILLVAPERIRIERIAKRDKLSFEKAKEATLFREKIERERFSKIYNINIDDKSIYDMVLNTDLLSFKSNITLMKHFILEFIKLREGK
jgi:predicted cytidylate kinase